MMRALGLALLTLMLSACQTPGTHPAGTSVKITLNQSISIPPERARLYFQHGHPASGINEFETNCVFEIKTVRETAQRIVPDTFIVTQLRSGSSWHMTTLPSMHAVQFGLFDSGPMRYYYKTEMFLHSPRQPDVFMLTCQHAWYTGDNFNLQRPPTLDEMRQALGSYFTLILETGI